MAKNTTSKIKTDRKYVKHVQEPVSPVYKKPSQITKHKNINNPIAGKVVVGGASRDSTGFGALEEGLISPREQSPAFLRNSNGRLDLPGPTQEAA